LKKVGSHKIWNRKRVAASWLFRETRKEARSLEREATVPYQTGIKKEIEGRKRQTVEG
jgi:hypothetical protein